MNLTPSQKSHAVGWHGMVWYGMVDVDLYLDYLDLAGLSSRMVSASDCGVRGPRFESRR